MKLSDLSIKQLVPIVTGGDLNDKIRTTPYKSGPQLIELFNTLGFRDTYTTSMPNNSSRKDYTFIRMKEINNTKNMQNLIDKLADAQNYLETEFKAEDIVSKVNEIIKYDGYKLEHVKDIFNENKFIIVGNGKIIEDEIDIRPSFENIQAQIINEIRSAKFIIWVAVAWFTDKVLFQELINKSREGLNIQIVICKDEINNNSGIEFEKFFKTYKIESFGKLNNNILHHKFCIIDLNKVIQGSYNWTNRAQYNNENIDIVKGREHAEKYAERFKLLKTSTYK